MPKSLCAHFGVSPSVAFQVGQQQVIKESKIVIAGLGRACRVVFAPAGIREQKVCATYSWLRQFLAMVI